MKRMTADEFNKVKSKVTAKTRPSSRDLEGIMIDLDYFLEQSDVLQVVKRKKTGELHRLIEVRCKLISKSTLISDVAAEIERVWTEYMAYWNFEAHALHFSSDELIFDFITGTQYPDQYIYITGSIIVTA
jgi:hypothetical protein